MCLMLIAYNAHPDYRLILASNRDEFYSRKTEPLAWRVTDAEILCGLDCEGGGSWLAAARSGRIAALTNVREPGRMSAGARSRGLLVTGCAASDQPIELFLEELLRQPDRHNGFNLIAADGTGLYYCSNRTGTVIKLSNGLYGLSNHRLDTPWPKLVRAKELAAEVLAAPGELDTGALFDVLRDDLQPPDQRLPDTGVGPVWERILAPVFIRSGIYGTRTSSLVLLDHCGFLRFIERTHGLPDSSDRPGTRELSFAVPKTGHA